MANPRPLSVKQVFSANARFVRDVCQTTEAAFPHPHRRGLRPLQRIQPEAPEVDDLVRPGPAPFSQTKADKHFERREIREPRKASRGLLIASREPLKDIQTYFNAFQAPREKPKEPDRGEEQNTCSEIVPFHWGRMGPCEQCHPIAHSATNSRTTIGKIMSRMQQIPRSQIDPFHWGNLGAYR